MVVLLGVALLPLQEVRPPTDVLQALLGVPHRDDLQGLIGDNQPLSRLCLGILWNSPRLGDCRFTFDAERAMILTRTMLMLAPRE